MVTSKNPKNMEMMVFGFPKVGSKSYQSEMKQSNSMELSGYSFLKEIIIEMVPQTPPRSQIQILPGFSESEPHPREHQPPATSEGPSCRQILTSTQAVGIHSPIVAQVGVAPESTNPSQGMLSTTKGALAICQDAPATSRHPQ